MCCFNSLPVKLPFALVVFLLSALISYSRPPEPKTKYLAPPTGLREAWLGTSVTTFRHLVPERRATRTPIVYYTRSDESLRVGPYTVTGISYGFYQDQLCCIEVRVLGAANCQGIQDMLYRAHGLSPAATAATRWAGSQVSLSYTEMPKGYATVVLASTTLLAQYRAAQQELIYDLT